MKSPVIKTIVLLTLVLFWVSGTCDGGMQRLICPYNQRHEGLPRVWCKQSSEGCCTGISFSRQAQSLDDGRLEVQQFSNSFTVDVHSLAHGGGVYWCGVLGRNDTIVKLAEGYFHSSSLSYVWGILRWFTLPLLLIINTSVILYLHKG